MNIKVYLPSIKNQRKRNFIETALRLGINVEVINPKQRIIRFTKGKKTKYLLNEEIYLNRKPGTLFTKNKDLTKRILSQHNISVPSGFVAETYQEVRRKFKKQKMSFPIIVKPIDGAKGVGVFVDIRNNNQLKEAINKLLKILKKNKKLANTFLIEEMEFGNDYRVLVLNGKTIACIQRVPAYIVGDGVSTIRELIDSFNKKRPDAFKLYVNSELRSILREKEIFLEDTLKKGIIVQLRKNANISSGGRSIDKTKDISRRFKKIAEACTQFLGLKIGGIDIIAKDIKSENTRQDYSIIEVNGAPQHDIHEKPVITGKGVDVTKLLIKEFMRD